MIECSRRIFVSYLESYYSFGCIQFKEFAAMKFHCTLAVFWFVLFLTKVMSEETSINNTSVDVKPNRMPRQMEYLSLISTLLQQTSLLTSVDGVFLAASTIAAAALSRARPLLVAGFLSYLLYAGTALLAPGTAARIGIFPQRGARSVAGGVVAETLLRTIQFTPVMTVVTNVTVSVVTEAASRVRMLARSLSHQLRWVQGRVSTWSVALQTTCMERFLCRVGRFTQDTFPIAAVALRSIG